MLIITFNILYIMRDLQSCVLSQTIQITNDSTIGMYQNQRLAVVYHPQFIAAYHQCAALYIIKSQTHTRSRVMISSPTGADYMHLASRGDDMPSLRLG